MKMNPVIHFELPAKDMTRMKKFYADTFGWQMQDMGPDMGNYVIVTTTEEVNQNGQPKTPGQINGGLTPKGANSPYPTVTLQVDDIKEHMEKIKKSGGKIVTEIMPVGDMGLLVYFEDTEGNITGIWQNVKKG